MPLNLVSQANHTQSLCITQHQKATNSMIYSSTLSAYNLIRCGAFIVDQVVPAAIIYWLISITAYLSNHPFTSSSTIHTILFFYTTLEFAFYIYFRAKLAHFQTVSIVKPLSKIKRQILMNKILGEYDRESFAVFISGWYRVKKSGLQVDDPSLIKAENFKQWMAWAFFGVNEFSSKIHSKVDKQLNELIIDLETQNLITLEPGINEDIKVVVLNSNKVEAAPKTFLIYLGILGLEFGGNTILSLLGFKYTAKDKLAYWYKPSKSKSGSNLPIVFVHGIGAGLFAYINFILRMCIQQSENPIYILDLPHVSMRLCDPKLVGDSKETISAMKTMLASNKHTKALYESTLAWRFVYRKPKRTAEFLTHWFIGRELYVSYYISRFFTWHHNTLFPESLPQNAHVFLSEVDNLVDAPRLLKYLERHDVDCTLFKGVDHAQFIVCGRSMKKLLRGIKDVVKRGDSEASEYS